MMKAKQHNTSPLVTVVTPSYNQGQFLEATIKSVIEQSYPNLEYFLFDGGSTDGSVDIIRRYESRLAYWVSESDKGQSDAINKGFARASGKYIAWLNSDDIYFPGTVRKAVAELEKHNQAGLVYANCSKIDETGEPISWPKYRQFSRLDLLSMRTIAQPTVFIRRAALEKVGFLYEGYHCLMDHHLWIRIASQYEVVFIDDYWAGAREHPAAKNFSIQAQFAAEAHQIAAEMSEFPNVAVEVSRHKRQIETGIKVFEAGYMLGDGHSMSALRLYLSAICQYPPVIFRSWKLMILSLVRTLGLSWVEKILFRIRNYRHGRRYKATTDKDTLQSHVSESRRD